MTVAYAQNGVVVRQAPIFTGVTRLVNIMPVTGVKVVDDAGYIGGDFLGVYYPSTNYYNNFAIQLVGSDFSEKGLGRVTIVDTAATVGGREYRTVTIGGATWLAENLDYKFSGCGIGGGVIPSTPNAWYYDNNEATYGIDGTRKCGLLYNWYACKLLNDNRSELVPGWHVPTNDEWTALANAVGGTGVAGTRLKAANVSWATSWGGTDDYGFGVLPAGKNSNGFAQVSSRAYFWTITENGSNAYYRSFEPGAVMYQGTDSWYYAYSIRLVKDTPAQ